MKVSNSKNVKTPEKDGQDHRSSSRYSQFQHLKDDPEFRDFLRDMINNRSRSPESKVKCRNHESRGRSKHKGIEGEITETVESNLNVPVMVNSLLPLVSRSPLNNQDPSHVQKRLFKSPSDITIYSPGLCRINQEEVNIIDKISNFVEKIQLDSNRTSLRPSWTIDADEGRDVRRVEMSGKMPQFQSSPSIRGKDLTPVDGEVATTSRATDDQLGRVTEQQVLQAEKFKAKVKALKGNNLLEL